MEPPAACAFKCSQEAPPLPAAGPAPLPRGSSGSVASDSGSVGPLRRGGGSAGGEGLWGVGLWGAEVWGDSQAGVALYRVLRHSPASAGKRPLLSPDGRGIAEAGPGAERCGEPRGGRLQACLNSLFWLFAVEMLAAFCRPGSSIVF